LISEEPRAPARSATPSPGLVSPPVPGRSRRVSLLATPYPRPQAVLGRRLPTSRQRAERCPQLLFDPAFNETSGISARFFRPDRSKSKPVHPR
jgi:hypothetical protein